MIPYKDITVPETVFHQKSVKQKQAVLKKFNNQEVKSNENLLPVNGEDEGTRNNPLSISEEQSGIICVPFKVLKQMFQKLGYIYHVEKRLLSQHLEVMSFLNTCLLYTSPSPRDA